MSTFSIGLTAYILAVATAARIYTQEQPASGPESQARELWAKVRKATDAMDAGTLDFYYRLGHQADWPEVHIHAAWYKQHLILSLMAPTKSRADFEISGRTILDRGAGISRTIQAPTMKPPGSDVIFRPPFKLGFILAILFDPSSRAFNLAGDPTKVSDDGNNWVFSFPVPKGYDGPGYLSYVSKTTMLPIALSRKGERMPELSIRYRISALSADFSTSRGFAKGPKGSMASFSVAYDQSQFRREYGNVFRTPPKGP